MGLDMYLYARKKGENCADEDEDNYEVAYWRKANQIRNWFINHIPYFSYEDNLGEYDISKELLIQLYCDVKTVLKNHKLADKLFPTSSGFFFGSTEYDEYYFKTLRYTKKILEEIFNDINFDREQIYYTEWW